MKRKKSVDCKSYTPDDSSTVKRNKVFSGILFRQKLSSDASISALQQFLQIFQDHSLEQDIVLEYFESGGNGEEILLLLGGEDRSLEEISIIFNVLECIFMRIMTGLSSYLPDAEETAKCLLQTHLPSVCRMLAINSSFEAKVSALKLLTVMSTLSTKVAKYILSYLKINFSLLCKLTRHGKQHSTRTHFIHFVLSFVVDSSPSVINLLLDKTGLLRSIFPGLIYDTADTVDLVLATVKKNILENPSISKTIKLHTFNSTIVKIIFELFNWKGPQRQVKKKPVRNLSETLATEVDLVSKSHVEEAVYQFLRILCASRKFGVVFFDHTRGTSGKNQNQLVYKVLEALEKPWEQKYVAKLLLEIFVACPDLILSTTSRMAPSLEPRLSSKWFKAINFLEKVIDSVVPSTYLSKSTFLTRTQLLQGFGHTVTPKPILQIIFGSPLNDNSSGVDGIALMNTHLLVRHSAVHLLNSITKCALRFLDYNGLEDYFGSLSAANQFRQNFLDHLFMALPNVSWLLNIWKQAIHDINNEEVNNEDLNSLLASCNLSFPSSAEHLRAILSVLLTYARWWPPLEITAEGDSVEDGWGLLNNLNFLLEAQKFEGLEAMALELLSITGGFTLSSDQGLSNQDIMKRLLHLYGKEREKACSHSWRQLILSILLKTGLFDGNEIEACLWIYCYLYCCRNEYCTRQEECDALADFIVSSLCGLISSSEHYMCIISQAFEGANNLEITNEGESKNRNITRRLLIDMMEKDIDSEESSFMFGDQKNYILSNTATISPLLPAALVEAKNYDIGTAGHDAVNCYLLHVVLHIFHGQDSSKPLLCILMGKFSSYSPPKSLQKYLKSWSSSKPQSVGELLPGDNPLCHFSSMLLNKTKQYNLFFKNCSTIITTVTDGLDVLFLFRVVIFHLANLAQQDNLTKDTLAIGKYMLLQLIQHSCLSEKEENFLYCKTNGKNIVISGLCLQSALNNSTFMKFFEPLGGTNDSKRYVTELVDQILNFANTLQDDKDFINDLSLPFKNKLLQNICTSLGDISEDNGSPANWDKTLIESFLSHFILTSENIMYLLNIFGTIPPNALVDPSNWVLSGPGLLLTKLLYQLCKLKKMGYTVIIKSDVFKSVSDLLCSLEEKLDFCTWNEAGDGLSELENCILQLLQIFPHLIEIFNQRILQFLVTSKLNRKSANSLGQFLIKENENFRLFFLKLCTSKWNEMSSHPDRLLFYLTSTLEGGKCTIPDVILMKLYKEYKGAIKETFNKFHEAPLWLERNTQLFKLIIQRIVDEDVCYKLWNQVKRKIGAMVEITHSFLEIVVSVFEKAGKSSSLQSDEFPKVSLLKLLLNGFVKVLKSTSNDASIVNTDVIFYTELVCAALERKDRQGKKSNEGDEMTCNEWQALQKDQIWREFTQLALKVGLSQNNSSVLKCFGKLCSKVLIKEDSEAILLYKMSIMHSKFLDVMLENSIVKGEILEILLVLIEKNPASLSTSLIPVLLSSYGATLGRCDLLILKLLKMLDSDGLNFHQFSPYLWGEMAASFYSLKTKVKSTAFSAFSVLRQPKADQVLDLIDLNRVEKTVSNFPIHRGLQAEVSFDINSADSDVYDPGFYLPLLSHILAPENPVKVYRVVQSGAFALTVAALGSYENEVRAGAMHVVARFYSHLEAGRLNKEKKLWMNFIDSLRNGFGLLAYSKNADVSSLQLPPVVAIFLAKASLVMTQPQHIMFFPLHNFFLAKPALDLAVVPEFFRLFNSFEEKSRSYRHWILEVLRDGLKDPLDFHTCLNSGIFKLLPCCFCSVVCDERSKVLILEILTSAVKIPSIAYYLVKGHGLISWLLEVIHQLPVCSNKEDPYIARSLIHLFSSLWLAFYKDDKIGLCSEKETQRSSFAVFISNNMLQLHLYILPKIVHVDLDLKDFFVYIKTLWTVTQLYYKSHQRKVKLINRQDINNIILLGKNILKYVDICQDAVNYGYYVFPTSKELFTCLDETSNEALQYLFKFVVSWCQNENQ